jgi:hypothetical protein
MVVPPGVLTPTLCVSRVGVATANGFPTSHSRNLKVHTGLLSMLVANEISEDLVLTLLGSSMLKSLVEGPQGTVTP